MKNAKETVISEFEIDFKKSCLSFSSLILPIPSLKTGVENNIFQSEIGSGFGEPGSTPHQKFPEIPPPPPAWDLQVSKRNTLSYINRNLVPILREQLPTYPWNSHGNEDVRCFCLYFHGQNREPNIELY